MLVPFSYNNPFWDGLQAEERCYDVAGIQLSVRQQWKPDGRGGSRLGFGASVYDAAFVLSHFLAVLRPGLLPGRTVLDIGTGLGLSSLACAISGAQTVVATDGDADLLRESTLPNLQRNMQVCPELQGWGAAAAPSLPPSPPQPAAVEGREAGTATDSTSASGSAVATAAAVSPAAQGGATCTPPDRLVHVAPLMWGDTEHETALLQCLQGHAPEVIIAADIVAAPYEDALPLLAESLQRLMGPHTSVYIAHKPRHVCEERWFRRIGKVLDVCVLPRETSIHRDFLHGSPIRIVRLRHKARATQQCIETTASQE